MENVILSPIPLQELESRIDTKLDLKFQEIKSFLKTLQNNDEEDILSFREGCAFLNIAEPTGYAKVSKREVPYMKRGKFIYFSKKQLTEWLHSGRKKTIEELDAEATKYITKKSKK